MAGRHSTTRGPLDRTRRSRRRRGRRRLIALGLVLAVLTGAAVIIGSVFYASVDLPEDLDAALSQSSTVYYSDGTTVMGELAAEDRTSVGLDQIADDAQWALVAAEDADFYEHPGVDVKGVLRALVNNVSGGDQQGASTLTQQYVGLAADIRGDGSYLRKAREAAMAMKMEEEFTKDQILNHYLNLVYFGRGAYGIEAAAQAFFGISAADLSTSQSALLIAQIKSPDGPYDPYSQSGSTEDATDRWNYVLDRMVEIGKLDQTRRDALTELPETLDPSDDSDGLGPEGFITHGFVLSELADAGITSDEVLRGGFDIVTTIDAELQQTALEDTGIREVAEEDGNLAAALAAVEPGTGRVLAYYGGENGAGLDLADDVGHRPGTAFNVVVLAAAIELGYDPWSEDLDGSSPRTFPSYVDEDGEVLEMVNTGGASDPEISLYDAVSLKLDTPVYDVAESIGGDAIAETAAALGIERLWDPHAADENGVLAETDPLDGGFAPDIGIGAYPVTVLDMATLYATLAADGTAAEPYFTERVEGPDGTVYEAEPRLTEHTVSAETAQISASAAAPSDEIDEVLTEAEADGEPYTWEQYSRNASPTWSAGSSAELSIAVWAGDETKEGDGSSPEGTLAESIWRSLYDARPERYRSEDLPVQESGEGGPLEEDRSGEG